MNKIIVTGDYKSFIDKNVIDGKLNFTNMVPKPDDIVKEENNYYIVKYYTDDLLLVFNQDGNSFNCSIDCGNLVAVEYNDFYSWCR